MYPSQTTLDRSANRPVPWRRAAVFVSVLAAAATTWFVFRDELTLQRLAGHEAALRQLQQDDPVLVYALLFGAYVLVTALSIPLATVLTVTIGWYFGFWRGVALVSFASTTGATLAFLMSRYLLRGAVESRFGSQLAKFNAALDREGAFYLFALRVTPAVPFFVINAVMGLTRMRAWTFWWVSQLGMLAGTCVLVYAGSSVSDLTTLVERGTSGLLSPQLIVAFVALGLFPLVAKRVLTAIRRALGKNPGDPQ